MTTPTRPGFPHRHLLGIEGLSPLDIAGLLDRADEAVEISRQVDSIAFGRGDTRLKGLLFVSHTAGKVADTGLASAGSELTMIDLAFGDADHHLARLAEAGGLTAA